MMIEVLCSVVVNVGQRHGVFEVRIPAHREMHGSAKAGFVLAPKFAMQPVDDPLQQPLGPGRPETVPPAQEPT